MLTAAEEVGFESFDYFETVMRVARRLSGDDDSRSQKRARLDETTFFESFVSGICFVNVSLSLRGMRSLLPLLAYCPFARGRWGCQRKVVRELPA